MSVAQLEQCLRMLVTKRPAEAHRLRAHKLAYIHTPPRAHTHNYYPLTRVPRRQARRCVVTLELLKPAPRRTHVRALPAHTLIRKVTDLFSSCSRAITDRSLSRTTSFFSNWRATYAFRTHEHKHTRTCVRVKTYACLQDACMDFMPVGALCMHIRICTPTSW